jgi:hypothetical protein
MTRRDYQTSCGKSSSNETITTNRHVIVSNGEGVRHRHINPHVAAPVEETHLNGRESGTNLTALNTGTVFVTHVPKELGGALFSIVKRETTGHPGSRLALSNDNHRLASLTPTPFFPLAQCGRQRLLRIDTKSHRRQKGALRLGGRHVPGSGYIVVLRRDSNLFGKLAKE